jgi:predicted O-methyltransferase YrrM
MSGTRRGKILKAISAGFTNILMGGNGVSLGLIGQPRRLLVYTGETRFLYGTYTGRRGVPQKTVFEVCGNDRDGSGVTADIKLTWVTPDANPWFQPIASYAVDLVALCSLCALVKPKVVFEIGTLTGYTALHFALNTPPEADVYTLDLPASTDQAPALRTTVIDDAHIHHHNRLGHYAFDGYPEAAKIHALFGDSAQFDYKPFEGRVDLFFIDGAHSYEYVRQDTLNALSCCHSGSVIVWHDYGRTGVNGVSRWIDELAMEHEIYAVPGSSVAFTVLP